MQIICDKFFPVIDNNIFKISKVSDLKMKII